MSAPRFGASMTSQPSTTRPQSTSTTPCLPHHRRRENGPQGQRKTPEVKERGYNHTQKPAG
ncbi:uncharacterized protein THITE_2123827 [Thermothielavioides terrestris NRRL 8126]|uniref:Uncharacterized protein n=1 Tax=Thermothielavioides terrestris (strain ATCC 38088 / NRRL 8126) TaxID=578455 RepID=G2RHZ4_THETT|nr:uncharacterized protein THITE_2123827 [Thermothielavioides terrestris NRRL 8126]AEO71456.1 hypothetical protein THITE_2123827 [Thermothielavioides terrestris NRRL 8126]